MRISGSIPFNVARAYTLAKAQPPAAVKPSESLAAPTAVDPGPRRVGGQALEQLVAGRVAGAVEFDGALTPMGGDRSSLPLYTRAADRIEAAVAVQVGRTIDLTG